MKAPDTADPGLIAPCGIYCLACSAFLSPKNPCPGCRAEEARITRKSCRACKKKRCAQTRGLTWCFESGQFPCAAIRDLSKRYAANYRINLIQRGQAGRADVNALARHLLRVSTCPDCGGLIDCHHLVCSGCKQVFEHGDKADHTPCKT